MTLGDLDIVVGEGDRVAIAWVLTPDAKVATLGGEGHDPDRIGPHDGRAWSQHGRPIVARIAGHGAIDATLGRHLAQPGS